MKLLTKISLKIIIIILCFLLGRLNGVAQDLHFSQFTMTPLQLDPSITGKFGGDQRVILNYRDQWRSVAAPFKTYGFSFDTHLNQKRKDNFFGIGLSVYSDRAGDINLGLTTLNFALAYHIKIAKDNYFSAGVQGGFLQGSLDVAKMRFGNQFDGTGHNATFDSQEAFGSTNFFKPNFSVGISYSYGTNTIHQVISNNGYDGKKVKVGIGVHNVVNPEYSFLNDNNENLNFRYILHTNSSFGIRGTNMAIQPSGFIAYQQQAIDFVFGSYFRYNLKEKSKFTQFSNGAALNLGIHYRLGDALIPSLLIETGSLAFGVSYDMNLSGLTAASNGNGGFELSVRYISPNPFGVRKTSARFF